MWKDDIMPAQLVPDQERKPGKQQDQRQAANAKAREALQGNLAALIAQGHIIWQAT